MTPDGRYIAFTSGSSDLVSEDNDNINDVFVRDVVGGTTTLVSFELSNTTSAGTQSRGGRISPDGRYVVFESFASNLTSEGDSNGTLDVFRRDLVTGTTVMASANLAGTSAGDGSSSFPSVSDDGRYVTFKSRASNLVSGDSNSTADVFRRDLQSSTTELVSVNQSGNSGNSFSDSVPQLTPDGNFVLFHSHASDLVSGDNNGRADLFVRNMSAGTTTLVSVNAAGTGSADGGVTAIGNTIRSRITDDGSQVFFTSGSNDLDPTTTGMLTSDVYRRVLSEPNATIVSNRDPGVSLPSGGDGASLLDRATGSQITNRQGAERQMTSADGRFVAFVSRAANLETGISESGATNNVFVRDRLLGTTELISVNSTGTDGGNGFSENPVISDDGRYVAFQSGATDLAAGDTNGRTDVFLRDRQTGTTVLVSQNVGGTASANGLSSIPLINAGGTKVIFESVATDLVSSDTNGQEDIFVYDIATAQVDLISLNVTGTDSGDAQSNDPAISDDGRFVAFWSLSTDLVATDSNATADVFLRDLQLGTTQLVSFNSAGTDSADNFSIDPDISADGRFVSFQSAAENLATGDSNTALDIYVRDMQSGVTQLVSATPGGTAANANSEDAVISDDGRYIAFVSSGH